MISTVRVFISSPGDVAEERQIAGKVIEQLQGKYWSFVRLDDVFWERQAIRATAHYQDELVNPGDCEIVVGILWARLGSPLPKRFGEIEGTAITGTEWELEEAFKAYERSLAETGDPEMAKPDVLIYRRTSPRTGFEEEEKERESAAQEAAVDRYLRTSYFHQDGTIKRAFSPYESIQQFEENIREHLERLILRLIPGLKPGYEPPPISGNPFKGLETFDFRDNDRYFGRNREIREVQQLLAGRGENGCGFVLIYGASGYGKSSLMRAGLAPLVTRPGGMVKEASSWRMVLLQPAKGHGPLHERLARVLLNSDRPELSPALGEADSVIPQAGLPELIDREITGLDDVNNHHWDVAGLSRHLADPEDFIFAAAAIQEALEEIDAHLLLQLDQLEEVFSEGVGEEERETFFRALRALCRCPRVWGIGTMRSEFFGEIAGSPEFKALIGGDGGYILAPPSDQMLSEIIRFPALAARLDYERSTGPREIGGVLTTAEYLNDQILQDSCSSPDALPLLEFCLMRLYEETLPKETEPEPATTPTRNLLTWEAYTEMGGLKGAIASVAEERFESLRPAERTDQTVGALFASLVRVDSASNTATRRRAEWDQVRGRLGVEGLLATFLEAKLLVTDRDEESGRTVVFLAHECLLSHWNRLARWIDEHRADLAAHQRLIEQAELWEKNTRARGYLLTEARLAEAERVADSGVFALNPAQTEFLLLSRQGARKRLRFFQSVAGVFALVAVAAAFLGWIASVKQKEAEAALVESQRQLERSRLEEGKAWIERAQVAMEKKDSLSALYFAGRAMGFEGYGRETMAQVSKEQFPDLLGTEMALDGAANSERLEWKARGDRLIGGYRSPLLPLWKSPVFRHHNLEIYSAAFSPDGSRIASASHEVKVWDRESGQLLFELDNRGEWVHAIDFAQDRLVVSSVDKTIRVWDLVERRPVVEIKNLPREVREIAVSPDAEVVATGDLGGSIAVWDLETGEKVASTSGGNFITSIAHSSEGTRIAFTRFENSQVGLWDYASEDSPLYFGGHEKEASAVAFSPDGRWLASGSGDQKIILRNLSDQKNTQVFEGHGGKITSLAFHPDATRLGSSSKDNTIRIWKVSDGSPVEVIEDVEDAIHGSLDGQYGGGSAAIRFSPDGDLILTGSRHGEVRIWDMNSGQWRSKPDRYYSAGRILGYGPDGRFVVTASAHRVVIWDLLKGAIGGEMKPYDGGIIMATALSPGGDILATTAIRKSVLTLWKLETGEKVADYDMAEKLQSGSLYSLAFSPDGSVLAVGGSGSLFIVDVESGEILAELKEEGGGIWDGLVFSPDGTRVAFGWSDTVKEWSYRESQEAILIGSHNDSVKSLAYHPNDGFLASGSSDETLRIWNLEKLEESKILRAYPIGERHNSFRGAIGGLAFSPDGERIATSSADGFVRMWDWSEGVLLSSARHGSGDLGVAFDPSGKVLAAGGIWLWDVAGDRKIFSHQGQAFTMVAVDFRPDGEQFVSSDVEGRIDIWDWRSGMNIGGFAGDGKWVNSVAFSPTDPIFAAAISGRSIVIRETTTGRTVQELKGHSTNLKELSFSPDGKYLASANGKYGSSDPSIKIWDVATGEHYRTIEAPNASLQSVSFSPDGSRIATAGRESQAVWVWEISKGEVFGKIPSDSYPTRTLFSPDGKYLAIGAEFATIHDASSLEKTATLRSDSTWIQAMAFSPDGRILATGGSGGEVSLWDMSNFVEIASSTGEYRSIEFVRFSPDGRFLAACCGGDLKIWDVESSHRLVEVLNAGLLTMEDRSLSVRDSISRSLFEAEKFPVLRSRNQRAAEFITGVTERESALVYSAMQRLGRAQQWQELIGMWRQLQNEKSGVVSKPAFRELYLGGLLSSFRMAVEKGTVTAELLAEIAGFADAELISNSRFSLAFAQVILESLDLKEPGIDRSHAQLVESAAAHGESDWLQSVGAMAYEKWDQEDFGEAGKKRVGDLIGTFVRAAPRASELTIIRHLLTGDQLREQGKEKEAIESYTKTNSVAGWRKAIPLAKGQAVLSFWERLIESEEATPGDFQAAGTKAAELELRVRGEAIFLKAVERFPDRAGQFNHEIGKMLHELEASEASLDYYRAAIENPAGLKVRFAMEGMAKALEATGRIDEAWEVYRELIDLEASSPYQAASAGYFAAKHGKQEALEIFEKAAAKANSDVEKRFVFRMQGWAFINAGDHSGALAGFENARGLFGEDGEIPETDLLAGLALAQWLNDQRDPAIATYRELIQAGKQGEKPTDWSTPEKIAGLDWPDAEKDPLEEVRQAALEAHPDLAE